MAKEYYIGQIFDNPYPPEAADWCNANNCVLDDIIADDVHKTIINPATEPTPAERKKAFLKTFFKIEGYGYYRKKPKGYQSEIESINTANNTCAKTGGLPADTLIFYPEPNFKIEEQCTEQWLVAHQIKLPAMTAAQFDELYIAFVTAWNEEEH
jgi:hypothetical protein